MRNDHWQSDLSTTNGHRAEVSTNLRLVPAKKRRVDAGDLLGGRYRTREWVADGGMSEVWCARDERLDRDVAVKIATCGAGLPGVELLEHEASLLTSLDHPGIVKAYDVGRHEDLGYLVMPLLTGAPMRSVLDRLRTRREQHPVPLCARDLRVALGGEAEGRRPLVDDDWYRTVVRITVELLRAAEASHAGNVMHRDLKPANVVLTAGGHPVLVDFGLGGHMAEPGPDASRLAGTLTFFAPEQVRHGRAGADVRTDIYQLGLLLQEFLTLEPAFLAAEHGVEIRIERGDCTRPRAIDPFMPRSLEAVCLKARAANPADRYQSVTDFRADLESFIMGEPVSASGARWLGRRWSRLGRWVRRGEVVGRS